ncbi:MAG TPA: PepSY domain-containing protein [Gemmatimonadales bacterium]|nr:PepSY domain-containing protein [Gemmatimonadales bacterium]
MIQYTARLTCLFAAGVLAGCRSSSGPGQNTHYEPPNTEFAASLGIAPPVTQDQAMAIAATAAGGTALSVAQEREGGILYFEVKVDTPSGRKEVEVRASDGGVVEIEADDND